MSFSSWISAPVNWVYLAIGAAVLVAGFRVVTTQNVVRAALYLVATLGGTAGLFLMLGAEFVAWTLVLVYIGAVIVLFLFGTMITRAPMVRDVGLDNPKARPGAAVLSLILFVTLSYTMLTAFGSTEVAQVGEATDTRIIGEALLGRFVLPFEFVGFILLAALVGGITLARRDLTPKEEEERGSA
ncbi:MAG TPA: NADH-quinone oxidoreductase subunit J [Acidimicrobiia bacterium]|nr:NADH-quinone oxidoreductase subunit J [Acidimicrobiia bacterium]